MQKLFRPNFLLMVYDDAMLSLYEVASPCFVVGVIFRVIPVVCEAIRSASLVLALVLVVAVAVAVSVVELLESVKGHGGRPIRRA